VDYQHSLSISEKNLKNMISQTNFAVSDNEARPIQTGALFEAEKGRLTVVACDSFRLAVRREDLLKADNETMSFVVPGTALSEVEKSWMTATARRLSCLERSTLCSSPAGRC
jgi:DNA polymerase-3 subunit beta